MKHDHPFVIDAIVVLPDHLHTIWTLSPGDSGYAMRWNLIKRNTSIAVQASDACLPCHAPRCESGTRSVQGSGVTGNT